MPELYGTEAHSPTEIAARVEDVGVAKAGLALLPMFTLAVLAGGFIGLGGLFSSVVTAGSELGAGPTRLLGGVCFSLGLILVVIAGAELFTGNNLMVMAWVSRRITLGRLLRNFGVVYLGNFVGAAGLAFLVWRARVVDPSGSLELAAGKCDLTFQTALFRGVLCNMLVCLAVWIAMGAREVAGKVLAIVPPVAAFVAAGFEHCVANMYFIPLGMLQREFVVRPRHHLDAGDLAANLIPVTLGNLVGGALLVAAVYWTIYRRGGERRS